MKFYLKERHNSQFGVPYYVAMGNVPKKNVKKYERPITGKSIMIGFDSKDEYKAAIEDRKAKGYNVIEL